MNISRWWLPYLPAAVRNLYLLQSAQTGSEVHSASYFPVEKVAGTWSWPNLHLMSRFRTCGVITLLPCTLSWRGDRQLYPYPTSYPNGGLPCSNWSTDSDGQHRVEKQLSGSRVPMWHAQTRPARTLNKLVSPSNCELISNVNVTLLNAQEALTADVSNGIVSGRSTCSQETSQLLLPFKDETYPRYIRTQSVPRCKHSPLRL